MKTLGLLRHAKSDWSDDDKRDFDRGLNARGRRGAALIGAHIRECGPPWDLVLASPAERVIRTLEAAEIGTEPRFVDRLYLACTSTILEVLRTQAMGDAVLLVGHNPGLEELLGELCGPAANSPLLDVATRKFPTAAFALLKLAIEDWNEVRAGCGTLKTFTPPRDLDPELGPET